MAARRALRPLLDRVLVERIVAPTKSVGGVLLPESMTSSKMREATVLAVGPGRRTSTGELVPLDVETGDVVALPEFGGVSVELGDESAGKEYAVYREEEILAVVTKN